MFVDQVCRRNYELEDLAEHFENKLQEYCQVEREDYKRAQQRKPPSFIAKKEQRLMDLASEVLGKAARRSEHRRTSVAPARPSARLLAGSNKFEVDGFNTPKNNEPARPDPPSKEELREKRKKDSSRDSIEILKSMRKERREEATDFRSPKFPSEVERAELGGLSVPVEAAVPVERCRSMPASE